ncbi:MAG: TolC family protein [Rikenellaceae bacterium]|nr:TolC family protein [Rikenellaceae bacterium]
MTYRNIISALLFAAVTCVARPQSAVMTLGEARMLMRDNNPTLQLARGEQQVARNERQALLSSWFPTLSVSGGYAWMSNPVEVRQSLSRVTEPLQNVVADILPNDVIIGQLLGQIGGRSLSFPLVPQSVMTVDATLMWPVFTGGRRLFVGRLGRELESGAEVARNAVDAELQLRLVESYYAVTLAGHVCEVRRRSVAALERHLRSARRMLSEGVIGATELLMVEVAAENAHTELLAAENNLQTTQAALRGVLCVDTTDIAPITPMFVVDSLPTSEFFRGRAESNFVVQGLMHGVAAADLRLRMSRGGYAPTVALVGKQTLYSRGLNRHLVPRTIIGVGVSWTLFDGLRRERDISSARMATINSRLAHSGALERTKVSIDRLLSELHNAEARIRSGRRAVALNRRVLKNRQREWEQGVVTIDLVADAEVALVAAQVGVLTAFYAYDVALMGLLAMCGCPELFYDFAARAVDTPLEVTPE